MITVGPGSFTAPSLQHASDSLANRFYKLLSLSSAELDESMIEFARGEFELPEPARYMAALSRLRAWLALDSENARILAGAFERAGAALPPEWREQRIEAERAVMLNALHFEQFRRLAQIVPWMREGASEGRLLPAGALSQG